MKRPQNRKLRGGFGCNLGPDFDLMLTLLLRAREKMVRHRHRKLQLRVIAEICGTSRQTIVNIEQQAVHKLRLAAAPKGMTA